MEDENESCGWPGDGSGEDDFADYNQNEADDYREECDGDSAEDSEEVNESEMGHDEPMMEDQHLDGYYESLTDLGD